MLEDVVLQGVQCVAVDDLSDYYPNSSMAHRSYGEGMKHPLKILQIFVSTAWVYNLRNVFLTYFFILTRGDHDFFTRCARSLEEKCNKMFLKALFQINSTKANILIWEFKKMRDE